MPQLSRADWQLRIHGMVDREITYRFEDLERFEVVEKVVTLACVSNPVGGDLISNAVWTGYRVRDLLADAGVQPDADMVLSTSVDGFTAGTPVEALTDGRDALLAVGMNGEPLPAEHGYPARLVVPGLYGYVSATKWVVDLELTRFDRAEAYWTRLGWSARGPIKTESRIDVPRSGQDVAVGPGDVRRRGVGAEPRGPRRRGADRRRRTGSRPHAGRELLRRDLAAVEHSTGEAARSRVCTRSPCAPPTTPGRCRPPQRADPVPDGATGLARRSSSRCADQSRLVPAATVLYACRASAYRSGAPATTPSCQAGPVQLVDVATASADVGAASARLAKIARIADLLA